MSYKIGVAFGLKLFASCSSLYSDWDSFDGSQYVNKVSENGLSFHLWNNDSVLMLFYAPWCPHCTAVKPEYARAAQTLAKDFPGCSLAAIDCVAFPGIMRRYNVQTFPTIKYFRRGEFAGDYGGSRSQSGFVGFMLQFKNQF